MLGRSLTALWHAALALMVLKGLADLVRGGNSALALAAVILPLSMGIFLRARGSAGRVAPFAGAKADEGAAVFRRLPKSDQVHIASLAASGNAIGAIRALRKLVDVDLRTARDAIKQITTPTDDEAV